MMQVASWKEKKKKRSSLESYQLSFCIESIQDHIYIIFDVQKIAMQLRIEF